MQKQIWAVIGSKFPAAAVAANRYFREEDGRPMLKGEPFDRTRLVFFPHILEESTGEWLRGKAAIVALSAKAIDVDDPAPEWDLLSPHPLEAIARFQVDLALAGLPRDGLFGLHIFAIDVDG